MAIDLGLGVVINQLGIRRRRQRRRQLHSTGPTRSRRPYFHADLVQGNGDLSELRGGPGRGRPRGAAGRLPRERRYDVDRWAAVAEFGRGLQGESFHGGGEFRLGAIDVRGGAAYSRELWSPSGGVGLNMSPAASHSTWRSTRNSANVERKRNPAIALSLRFNR